MRPLRLAPLFLLVLAGLLVLSAERTWWTPVLDTGVRFAATPDGVVVSSVAPDSAAEQAGLKSGDRLIEVAGRPVRTVLVAQDLFSQVRPERPLGVVVERDGAAAALRVHLEARASWRTDRIASSIVAALFLLAAGAALLRPRAGAATVVYVAWCIAGALVLGVSWSHRGDRLDWLLFWIDRAARLVLPALWIHLALAFQGARSSVRRWLPVAYAPATALLLVEIHLVGLGGALRSDDPVALVQQLHSRVELGWLVGGFLIGLVLLFRGAVLERDPAARARSRWFVAGTLLGLAPYLVLSALPELVSGAEPSFSWISLPFLALLPLMFTSAVLDYRLMDLTFFLRRAVTLAATIAFSIVLFLGLLRLADLLLPAVLHPAGIVPALVAGVITAALAPAIRAGTRDFVGRLFYRRRYSFRRALERVARDLNAERDLLRLSEALERRVAEALDAGVVRLLLCGPGGALVSPDGGSLTADRLAPGALAALERGEVQTLAMMASAPARLPGLNQAGVQVLTPLRVEGRLIAVLAVGPRPGGGLLDTDDLDLLRSVSAHAAAAVAGALHLAELRQQVQLVQRLQARTEALIEGNPIGIAVLDHDSRIQHWNPALEDLLGVRSGSALGRHFAEVLPPSLRVLVREFLRFRPASGRSRAYRIRVGGSSAPGKLADLTITVLSGPDEPEGLLLTVDDVTDRVRLEEQLIQQDRLASVGLLAAGVAHEVNTPLTGISSYAQLLLEDAAPNDPRRTLLEKIVQQAGRASQIARGLLRFSRPSPAAELSCGPVNLNDVLEETVGLLGPQIRKAHATVECSANGAPVVALGDRVRLQQVAINLLLNALDAVRPGGHVAVRTGLERDLRVWFEIRDDGVGITEELKGRIFDPFFTTKKPGQGTGLGLSISYSIVREHGGALTAESEPGRGTVMRVVLPAAVALAHTSVESPAQTRRAG